MAKVSNNNLSRYDVKVHALGLKSHDSFGWGNFLESIAQRLEIRQFVKHEIASVKSVEQIKKAIQAHLITDVIKKEKVSDDHAVKALQLGYDVYWAHMVLLKINLMKIKELLKKINDEVAKKRIKQIIGRILETLHGTLVKQRKFDFATTAKARGQTGVVVLVASKIAISDTSYLWEYIRLRRQSRRAFKDESKAEKDLKQINNDLHGHVDNLAKHVKELESDELDEFKSLLAMIKRIDILTEDVIQAILDREDINRLAANERDIPKIIETNEDSVAHRLLHSVLVVTENKNLMINQLDGYIKEDEAIL